MSLLIYCMIISHQEGFVNCFFREYIPGRTVLAASGRKPFKKYGKVYKIAIDKIIKMGYNKNNYCVRIRP